jgi:hypothetical protein
LSKDLLRKSKKLLLRLEVLSKPQKPWALQSAVKKLLVVWLQRAQVKAVVVGPNASQPQIIQVSKMLVRNVAAENLNQRQALRKTTRRTREVLHSQQIRIVALLFQIRLLGALERDAERSLAWMMMINKKPAQT